MTQHQRQWEEEFKSLMSNVDDDGNLDTSSEDILEFIRTNFISKRDVEELVALAEFDVTPIKESMDAGMTLNEAEGVYCYATGYNTALSDLRKRLLDQQQEI